MTLFDAVYGDAYIAVEKILQACPLDSKQLRTMLNQYFTPDGVMEIEQKLSDGSWPLIKKNKDRIYVSMLPKCSSMPVTVLELRWLRNMCDDARAPLFLTDEQLTALRDALKDVPPLFEADAIDIFDCSLTGDSFEDSQYRECFHTVLRAFREKRQLLIHYVSCAGKTMIVRLIPQRLEYSEKDRRFRLHGISNSQNMVLNMAGIRSVELCGEALSVPEHQTVFCEEPLVIEVSHQRNTLARFMLEFSCFKKECAIDAENNMTIAKVWYSAKDEAEVLIRILGFGPTIRVTGPSRFVQRIRKRIEDQADI